MLKRVFSAHLKMWHLALVVVFLAMGTGSTSAAQTAMSPQVTSSLAPTAFFPNGAFNMAAAQSNTAMTVHAADGQVEVLRATFKVPTGQVADVAAFFNAEAYKYPNGYCYLQSFIDTDRRHVPGAWRAMGRGRLCLRRGLSHDLRAGLQGLSTSWHPFGRGYA